jgi:preprotein translocase subunit SecA
VALAGRVGAVTIATNMAGRGTDIILGGNPEFILKQNLKKKGYTPETAPEVVYNELKKDAEEIAVREHEEVIKLGGLHILGTERHEARRIDNQLRGRSGRQGDPGSSRFYISLEDDLMRILGADRVKNLLVRAGMQGGVPIENKFVSRAIENAQKQIESQNFGIRKHLLEYDDVMNKQRQYVYSWRKDILMGKDFKEQVTQLTEDIFEDIFNFNVDENKNPDDWDFDSLNKELLQQFGIKLNDAVKEDPQDMSPPELKEALLKYIKNFYEEKEKTIGSVRLREVERWIMLQIIDNQWKDNLLNIDHLKEGIGLRGYAQKDPLVEYKKESYKLFQALQQRIEEEVVKFLFLFRPVEEEDDESWQEKKRAKQSKPTFKMPGGHHKKKKKKK